MAKSRAFYVQCLINYMPSIMSLSQPSAKPASAPGPTKKTAAKTAVKRAAASLATVASTPTVKPSKAGDKSAAAPSVAAVPVVKGKHKLVRDSFTIPKPEYAILESLKLRAATLKRPVKKGELLRAGIAALQAMGDAAFLKTLATIPSLKTGRPGKAGQAAIASAE